MRDRRVMWLGIVLAAGFVGAGAGWGGAITTATLLEEMTGLEGMARWPEPGYRTVQFSSFDRRSTTSEAPGWFSNADGFGGEPIPGFMRVLREPVEGKPGLYLVAEVTGPGAIVRGWSAGMGGVMRVYLDPEGSGEGRLVWEGSGYDFLARRSGQYLKQAGVVVDAKDAFIQEDADYMPMPFERGLRVTWEGKLNELHFYHLQVRLYPQGTAVRGFDPAQDLRAAEGQVRRAIEGLTRPETPGVGEAIRFEGTAEAGRGWSWAPVREAGPGVLTELRLRLAGLTGEAVADALRGCLLRISFDGSQRPQVEAPVGDFFGSGPGVNALSSLPFTVRSDGTMVCRFAMPFEKGMRIEVVNHWGLGVRVEGSVRLGAWVWDDRSLYFHAKWRVDHDLLAGAGALDLPYAVVIGKGVFVGCAAMIMNPSGVPTAGGNWWGEGDEKILVDGAAVPVVFGTGSEDYFNYSWSRPDLFDHPYCGQPLDSGPDTSGFVSNHRYQVMDAVPFERSLAVLMELWAHNRTPGLSYGRVAYWYGRPGAVDDHRALMPAELRVPVLPKREPKALGGARDARFVLPGQMAARATAGRVVTVASGVATQLEVLRWEVEKGARLELAMPVEKTGRQALHLVAVHRPGGAVVRATWGGKELVTGAGAEVRLNTPAATRALNVNFRAVEMSVGPQVLAIECVEAGVVEIDYAWVKVE